MTTGLLLLPSLLLVSLRTFCCIDGLVFSVVATGKLSSTNSYTFAVRLFVVDLEVDRLPAAAALFDGVALPGARVPVFVDPLRLRFVEVDADATALRAAASWAHSAAGRVDCGVEVACVPTRGDGNRSSRTTGPGASSRRPCAAPRGAGGGRERGRGGDESADLRLRPSASDARRPVPVRVSLGAEQTVHMSSSGDGCS